MGNAPWVISLIIGLILAIGLLVLVVRLIFGLLNCLKSKEERHEKSEAQNSQSEVLKYQRTRNKMTQEFVAETLGVSRQAVSKWENGDATPSTSNLLALAKLYGVPAEELLKK